MLPIKSSKLLMPRSFSMSIIWKILAGLLASWAIVVLVEGPLVNLLCCMIFLLSVLDVIRISSLTVSFLRELDSGIVCLGITSLLPMIWMGFKSRVKIHLFLWALSVHLFYTPLIFTFFFCGTPWLVVAVQPCTE